MRMILSALVLALAAPHAAFAGEDLRDDQFARFPAIVIGRMGKAEEVAAQVALLASPLGGYTSGTNVVIDGGFTKRIQF